MDKRGISAIVATVLIILITVAAVTIIWVAIIPMIKDKIDFNQESVSLQIITLEGYTVYDSNTKLVTVQVEQGPEDVDLKGISFSFLYNGSSLALIKYGVPGPNQERVYYFNSSEFGKPSSVIVAPIFSDDRVGETSSTAEFIEGDLVDNGEDWSFINVGSEEEPRCGDGNLDDGEECDDGNTQDGDGCDEGCVVESESCNYGSWANQGCGLGSCELGEMYQTRIELTGGECTDSLEQCVVDINCILNSAVGYWNFDSLVLGEEIISNGDMALCGGITPNFWVDDGAGIEWMCGAEAVNWGSSGNDDDLWQSKNMGGEGQTYLVQFEISNANFVGGNVKAYLGGALIGTYSSNIIVNEIVISAGSNTKLLFSPTDGGLMMDSFTLDDVSVKEYVIPDEIGESYGSLLGGAYLENNVLVLDGVDENPIDRVFFYNINSLKTPNILNTVSLWIKTGMDFEGSWKDIIDTGAFGCDVFPSYCLRASSNNLVLSYFDVSSGESSISFSESLVNDNLWHHIVGTYNGSDAVLYLDGNDLEITPSPNDASGPLAEVRNFIIGRLFNGSIDDVMVYNRSLSQEEIQLIYANQTK